MTFLFTFPPANVLTQTDRWQIDGGRDYRSLPLRVPIEDTRSLALQGGHTTPRCGQEEQVVHAFLRTIRLQHDLSNCFTARAVDGEEKLVFAYTLPERDVTA